MSLRFLECLAELSFLEKKMLLKTNIEFIDYIHALNLVSCDHLCLGQNSVSISFCQGNCKRELIKINPKKGSLVKFTHP